MDKHVDIFESEFSSNGGRILISYSFDFGFGVWYGPAYSILGSGSGNVGCFA